MEKYTTDEIRTQIYEYINQLSNNDFSAYIKSQVDGCTNSKEMESWLGVVKNQDVKALADFYDKIAPAVRDLHFICLESHNNRSLNIEAYAKLVKLQDIALSMCDPNECKLALWSEEDIRCYREYMDGVWDEYQEIASSHYAVCPVIDIPDSSYAAVNTVNLNYSDWFKTPECDWLEKIFNEYDLTKCDVIRIVNAVLKYSMLEDDRRTLYELAVEYCSNESVGYEKIKSLICDYLEHSPNVVYDLYLGHSEELGFTPKPINHFKSLEELRNEEHQKLKTLTPINNRTDDGFLSSIPDEEMRLQRREYEKAKAQFDMLYDVYLKHKEEILRDNPQLKIPKE